MVIDSEREREKIVNKIIGIIMFIMTNITTRIVKRDRTIWCYGSWFGEKYADNTKYQFECSNQINDEVRHVWITRKEEIQKKLVDSGYECYLYNSLRGMWIQFRAGVFICTQGASDFNKYLVNNCLIINLWHGIPLKKILHDDKIAANKKRSLQSKIYHKIVSNNRNEMYVVSSSETITEIYTHAFRKDREHILQIGQPRNDVFWKESESLPFLKAFEGKKTIVYMPTHRCEGKLPIDINELFDLDRLDEFCGRNGYVFIIKKHFYHNRETVKDIGLYSNIIDITKENVDPQILLKNTDVLVCDYSSAYIDYLLLDRPIIFYNYDYENYLINDREMYFEYEQVSPGIKAKTFDEFMSALYEEIELGADRYREERGKVRTIFYDQSVHSVGHLLHQEIRRIINH